MASVLKGLNASLDRLGSSGPKSVNIDGLGEMLAKLKALPWQVQRATSAAVYQEAETIMGRSKREFVPVMDGILRASGTVEKPKETATGVSVTMGYGGAAAAYALAVHENPRSGKTGGVSPTGKLYSKWARVGGWKYLETPFLEAEKGMLQRIAARVRQALA